MAESNSDNKQSAAGKKIFVCDDDESIIHMVKSTLELEGFQVRTSRDGRDIVKKVLDFLPDLVVTDMMMPGAGGYDVIRNLQSDDLTRRTPVMIMTGAHLDGSMRAMMQQEPNFAGYHEKPLRSEKLVKEVHKILNTVSVKDLQKKDDPPAGGGGDIELGRWAF